MEEIMIIKYNEDLGRYTTIKIGGIANNFYIPESRDELIKLIETYPNIKLLGGGSNILINDKQTYEHLIYLNSFENIIENRDGIFYVGASVRNQKLINEVNKQGYGGLEYLYSVPGFIGGAIVMNAGRGINFNKSISDYILKVNVFVDGVIKTFTKDECDFSYRHSVFKDLNCVVLGAYLKLDKMSIEKSEKLKKERIKLCKNSQDSSKPNFGTFFCESNRRIMKLMSLFSVGKKNGCHFSKKTVNWIVNEGQGTYEQVIQLIKIVKILHKVFHKECKVEVEIWD